MAWKICWNVFLRYWKKLTQLYILPRKLWGNHNLSEYNFLLSLISYILDSLYKRRTNKKKAFKKLLKMKIILLFSVLSSLVSGKSSGEDSRIGCDPGWTSMGANCVRFTSSDKGTWNNAVESCQGLGGEPLAWRDETEWRIAELFFAEMQVVGVAREAWAGANHDGGD